MYFLQFLDTIKDAIFLWRFDGSGRNGVRQEKTRYASERAGFKTV